MDCLRVRSQVNMYGCSMSPPSLHVFVLILALIHFGLLAAVLQILASMRIIMGLDGTDTGLQRLLLSSILRLKSNIDISLKRAQADPAAGRKRQVLPSRDEKDGVHYLWFAFDLILLSESPLCWNIAGNDASPIVPMLIYYPSKISFDDDMVVLILIFVCSILYSQRHIA